LKIDVTPTSKSRHPLKSPTDCGQCPGPMSTASNKRTLPALEFPPAKRPRCLEVVPLSDHGHNGPERTPNDGAQDDGAQDELNKLWPSHGRNRHLLTQLGWSMEHIELDGVTVQQEPVCLHHTIQGHCHLERTALTQPRLRDFINGENPSPSVISSPSSRPCFQDQDKPREDEITEIACYGMVSQAM